MKVTALLDDKLIREVQSFSKGKTITESLQIALSEWLKQKKIEKTILEIEREPLEFQPGFTAEKARELSRT
ncbi:MAG: DUF2191 domain-containing protein [Leptospiraceae bacterium]|nr:DUF2191 domain-containing protein [Leptospiraceae bacterium]MCB1202449.1 DUF2191 domain-containing protein [Leptospiraceae bacterium]